MISRSYKIVLRLEFSNNAGYDPKSVIMANLKLRYRKVAKGHNSTSRATNPFKRNHAPQWNYHQPSKCYHDASGSQ